MNEELPRNEQRFRDLDHKTNRQLLTDLCGMSKPEVPDWRIRELLIQTRNAEASNRLAGRLVAVTWVLVALTAVLVVLTVFVAARA